MKCEGMPTQRLEEKRVEKRREWRSAQGGRERESTHMQGVGVGRGRGRGRGREREREREKACWLLLLCFFLHLGLPYANWA